MESISFILKTFVLTLIIFCVMQAQVNDKTLSNQLAAQIETSWMVKQMKLAANGGARMIQTSANWVHRKISPQQKAHAEAAIDPGDPSGRLRSLGLRAKAIKNSVVNQEEETVISPIKLE